MRKEQKDNKFYKILIASQDPGGTDAVWPVVKELLKKDNFRIKFLVGSYGQTLCKREKRDCLDAERLSSKKINFEFKKFNPDLVFTSTSRGFSVEKKILRIAKKCDIPTVSIIDYWSNYWARFICKKESKNLKYLPNKIIVTDILMKKQMIKEGFPSSRLEILGDPYFETFAVSHEVKKKVGAKKKTSILFISQPLQRARAENINLKYDEYLVLGDILDILKKINKENLFLTIRLHPLERVDKYSNLLKLKEKNFNIKVDKSSLIKKLIKETDLVLGMNSMVLFQSSLTGVPTISYQPQLEKKYDTLISNNLNLSVLSRSKKDLKNKIDSFIKKNSKMNRSRLSKKNINKYIKSGATKNIINLIFKMLPAK